LPGSLNQLLHRGRRVRHTGVKTIVPLIAPVFMFVCCTTGFCASSDVERARSILTEGTKDGNPENRKEATLAIGLIGKHERSTTLIAPLLDDPDVVVRVAAIATIIDLADRQAIPRLKKALEDPVPEVAFASAKALYSFKQREGKEALLAVLEGEMSAKSNPLRSKYREMMRMFHTPRTAALFALRTGVGFVPVPGLGAGVGTFESLLWNTELSPRGAAALLLAKDKDPEARHALVEALSDGEWSVRASAAQAIALRNDAGMRTALVPVLSDNDRRVRYRAAAAYLRLVSLAGRSPAHVRTNGRG
jgi:HEAT repeat protein